jgi:hypothetical protein
VFEPSNITEERVERERRGINQITIKQIILSHFTHLLVERERKREEKYTLNKKVKKQHHHSGASSPYYPASHTHIIIISARDIKKTGEKKRNICVKGKSLTDSDLPPLTSYSTQKRI